jgi:hypothetical protein
LEVTVAVSWIDGMTMPRVRNTPYLCQQCGPACHVRFIGAANNPAAGLNLQKRGSFDGLVTALENRLLLLRK